MTIYQQFKNKYYEFYDYLYENQADNKEKFYRDIALAYGDLLLKQVKEKPKSRDSQLISKLIEERQDYLTSDREITALGMAITYFH